MLAIFAELKRPNVHMYKIKQKKKKDGRKCKTKDGKVTRRKKSQQGHSSLVPISSKKQQLMVDLFPTLQPKTSDDSL